MGSLENGESGEQKACLGKKLSFLQCGFKTLHIVSSFNLVLKRIAICNLIAILSFRFYRLQNDLRFAIFSIYCISKNLSEKVGIKFSYYSIM